MTIIDEKIVPDDSSSVENQGTASPLSGLNPPKNGTLVPNRIFVGGISFNTNEQDLKMFFEAFGCVKEAKIIVDRGGISKGYGFITFETNEEVMKILDQGDSLIFKDKKLNIGPAIRKQQNPQPKSIDPFVMQHVTFYTPSNGVPFHYQDGMAYFDYQQPPISISQPVPAQAAVPPAHPSQPPQQPAQPHPAAPAPTSFHHPYHSGMLSPLPHYTSPPQLPPQTAYTQQHYPPSPPQIMAPAVPSSHQAHQCQWNQQPPPPPPPPGQWRIAYYAPPPLPPMSGDYIMETPVMEPQPHPESGYCY